MQTTQVNPDQLRELLSYSIAQRLPVLITGAPGIGKSDITAQATRDAGADMILSHPAVGDPTDIKGLPWIGKDQESATFLPIGELAEALRATRPTVWMIDDLGQATPAMQAACMQLLLARRVNGHALPDCVTFVAATNRRVDRAGVSGILEPVKSRFSTIVELVPSLDSWCRWAIDKVLPIELVAFLRFRPELLCEFSPTADLTNSPLPRTWANAAKYMGAPLPDELRLASIAGAVGEGAATEYMGFLRVYQSLPSIDGILLNPETGDIPNDPATLYAVTTGLGTKVADETFPNIARYAERLVEASKGEFAALLIRDCMERHSGVTALPAFAETMSGNLGQLVTGG